MGASYSPTKRRISFSNGAVVVCFSADEPDRLRGHQCDAAWADELAAWRYDREAWTQLMLGLRLGTRPRVVVTTTPRPTRIIRELVKRDSTHVTTGSTYENWDNLAATFTEEIVAQYEGTRVGLQELYAMILSEAPGALWNHDMFSEEGFRLEERDVPDLKRIVVAVDPAVRFDSEEGDETGIVVVGADDKDRGYLLDDLSSRMKPDEWGRRVVNAYYRWEADRVVAEVNQGGDMVEHTLRIIDPDISFKEVRASRGKITRAEPVAALYEKKRIHHVGFFDAVEDQCCTWEAGDPESPDRMDALVWGFTHLFLDKNRTIRWRKWATGNELKTRSYWRTGV
jgi:phage terminase large subunit-like protein